MFYLELETVKTEMLSQIFCFDLKTNKNDLLYQYEQHHQIHQIAASVSIKETRQKRE